ncbi:DUF305 domain-containing protein [Streptomyces solicathayae]|uniref:DUF305 domain-containing protein n=1 Tax=Streptomyces solicathayae TaxID=3081768 RepID=A0ABZ0M5L7_9ACTN|nr:DUF305 domain-containing protein [Streptomyces sp. HUAS YS2]WOX26721.1 DUF305 domain-containing protein [Streptomyces sp. HUAS YS2]
MIRTTDKRSHVRRATAVLAAGAAAVLLAACGSDGDGTGDHSGHGNGSGASASPSAPASKSAQNAADVTFAQGMIPHHRQAIEMADLAPTRAESPAVKKLAADIKNAQDPEIKTLSGWLTSWGEEVPAPGAMDHSTHGGDGDTGGMMTTEEMDGLKNAKGKAFDTAFMELMIKHHEGAVAMARTEQAQGAFTDARTMAQAIITSQSAEIAQMNKLLGKS